MMEYEIEIRGEEETQTITVQGQNIMNALNVAKINPMRLQTIRKSKIIGYICNNLV